ncbi:hypothetical protein AB0M48_28870 [Lentzea sp. NPDC051208]|uniref:hypothetical protein n=1 Tax=Lentzea sp. NPDC051208 TaxID=3154642 RepID=UPI00342E733B
MSDEMLSTDCEREDEFIHPGVFVAESPATSPVALFRLTTHAERDVRLALASRRDLPAKAYERLVNDADSEVAATAAANRTRKKPVRPTT